MGKARQEPQKRHVVRYIEICRRDKGTMAYWKKSQPTEVVLAPYRCGSWRHRDSACSLNWGQHAFVRIQTAVKSMGEGWVFLVLGFRLNPHGAPVLEDGKTPYLPLNAEDAYRKLADLGESFRRKLKQHYACHSEKGRYKQDQPFKYIEVVERHRSGMPHNNLLVWSPKLYEKCKGDGWKTEKLVIQRMKIAAGFGEHMETESPVVRCQEAVAGYMSKLIGQSSDSISGELTKSYQMPDNAPVHFRRLRSSRGLLPVLEKKSSEFTGVMVPASVDAVVDSLVELKRHVDETKAQVPEILIEESRIDQKAAQVAQAKAKAMHFRKLKGEVAKSSAKKEAG